MGINSGYELNKDMQEEYLANCRHKQITFSLTDFFFVEDGVYPPEFELVLVVMKDGRLSAGCVDQGSRWTIDNPHGIIHQSRGGVIEFDDVIAWKPIEEIKVNLN